MRDAPKVEFSCLPSTVTRLRTIFTLVVLAGLVYLNVTPGWYLFDPLEGFLWGSTGTLYGWPCPYVEIRADLRDFSYAIFYPLILACWIAVIWLARRGGERVGWWLHLRGSPPDPGGCYCRTCCYDLRATLTNTCPECGTPFNRVDPLTWYASPADYRSPGRWGCWAHFVLLAWLSFIAYVLSMVVDNLYP